MENWEYIDQYMTKTFDKKMTKFEINDKENDELKYVIRIQEVDDLLINIRTKCKTELTKEYEKEFALKDIQKDFNKFNSIDECRKEIISNIGKCLIKKEDYNTINFEIPLNNGKYTSIFFVLEERKREANAIEMEADSIINDLKKENMKLKSKIKFIK